MKENQPTQKNDTGSENLRVLQQQSERERKREKGREEEKQTSS